jgi:hypothetical protein
MSLFSIVVIVVMIILLGLIMIQMPTTFMFAAKPKPRQNSVPGIPGLNMDQRTCPTGYVLDILSNNCVKPPSVPQPQPQPQQPGVRPQQPPQAPLLPCKKPGQKNCIPTSGGNQQPPQASLPPCKKPGQKNCIPTSGSGGNQQPPQAPLPPCKKPGQKNCIPTSGSGGNQQPPQAPLPPCKKPGQKNCIPKPSSCPGNQVSQNGKCVSLCMSNNRPGFMNGGSCQAFNNNTSSGTINNPLFNKPITSNCNSQTQFQDKNGKCLALCVVNNVPGALRDGKCRKFSDTMLGKDQGFNSGGNGPGVKPPIKPPTRKPPVQSGPCPPGQKPSATNNKVCVVDLSYNPNGNCPPGQVFENGTCKVPQQGPPPPQKPIAIDAPNIPPVGCPPGATCNSSINYQGTNLNAYSYNGKTYIIKVVNGKQQPCIYMPEMTGGGFPCLDDYTVNFTNGQIIPNNDFENAYSH